jgi:hypothetical protein
MIYQIKELRNQCKTQAEIAVEVGLAQGTISLILRAHGLSGYLPETRQRIGHANSTHA